MKLSRWINIFKTGRHTSDSGQTKDWVADDLDKIVANFDPKDKFAPPLVAGHPKKHAPAYGWVAELRRVGDLLQARFRDVHEKAVKAVENAEYRSVSSSIMRGPVLRHVGLLGAAIPAVEGLGEVEFSGEDGEEYVFNFNQADGDEADPPNPEGKDMTLEEKLKAKEAELESAKKELDKNKADLKAVRDQFSEAEEKRLIKDRTARFEKLVADGKAKPGDKDRVLAFASAMGGDETYNFAEGQDKKPLEDHFWEFMDGQEKSGLYGEFSAPAQKTDGEEAVSGDLAAKF